MNISLKTGYPELRISISVGSFLLFEIVKDSKITFQRRIFLKWRFNYTGE